VTNTNQRHNADVKESGSGMCVCVCVCVCLERVCVGAAGGTAMFEALRVSKLEQRACACLRHCHGGNKTEMLVNDKTQAAG
jgi:hypothetical protein